MTLKDLLSIVNTDAKFNFHAPHNVEKAISFFNELVNMHSAKVISKIDCDVDGIFSNKILQNSWRKLGLTSPSRTINFYFNEKKSHEIDSVFIKMVLDEGYTHVILLDSSSNCMEQLEELSRNGIKVLIIDHHLMDYSESDYPTNVVIINNKFKEDEEIVNISAGFLTFLVMSMVCRSIRGSKPDMMDYVRGAVTLISDSCDTTDPYIMPIILGLTALQEIPLEVVVFLDQYTKLNRNFLTFKHNNIINNLCRLNKYKELHRFYFEGITPEEMLEMVKDFKELNKKTREEREALLEKSNEFCEDWGSVIFVDLDKADSLTSLSREYLENSTGVIGSMVSNKYGKATVSLISFDNLTYKGSGRSLDESFDWHKMMSIVDIDGGGHIGAVGFKLQKHSLGDLKDYLKGLEFSKPKPSCIVLNVNNCKVGDIASIGEKIAIYNEIHFGEYKKVLLSVNLSRNFRVFKYKKAQDFVAGDLRIKDTSGEHMYGDNVLIEPELNKIGHFLINDREAALLT